jgi:DNA (cytosine-5)-methyltransferase 1
MNYYNEFDPKAAAWLRELIKADLIPEGDVDERDIRQVSGHELERYQQCHFFAGIGGWPYALQLAGWPDDVRVWTGSCPCQPLSSAGQRKGEMDERHLWPEFYRLIAQCRPTTLFGEQVASNDGLEWLDGISLDLEDLDYAIAAADLPACSEGAPHQRQRIFWLDDSGSTARKRNAREVSGTKARKRGPDRQEHGHLPVGPANGRDGLTQGMDDPSLPREHGRPPGGEQSLRDECGRCNEAVGDAASAGPQGQWREYRPSGEGCSGLVGLAMQVGVPEWNGPTVAVKCSDGTRRVSAQPGSFPLATGLPARMGRLRGYGNAIVPQVAAKFIRSYIECAS